MELTELDTQKTFDFDFDDAEFQLDGDDAFDDIDPHGEGGVCFSLDIDVLNSKSSGSQGFYYHPIFIFSALVAFIIAMLTLPHFTFMQ